MRIVPAHTETRVGIGGGIVVRVVLDRLAFPGNFALLYGIATLVLFAGMLAFAFIRVPEPAVDEPATPRAKPVPVGQRVRNVLGGNPNFRWYIVARGLLILAFATTSFFPVYLVEEFGLPDSASGIFAVITAATFVLVNPIFGRVGNRVGYKPIFIVSYLSLAAAAVVGLLEIAAPAAYVLVVLTATSQSVNLLAWNMTVEFAPEGQVPSYIGVSGFFIGLVAPLAVFTGLIVDAFGYGALFAMTGVTALAGLVVMAMRVEEPRVAHRRLNQPDMPI